MNPYSHFRVVATKNLDLEHRHTLSLLYQPIIGMEAFSLYFSLYALIDRRKYHSTKYPHSLIFDLLNITDTSLQNARQKLEATGLLESYHKDDDYIYELYLPLSAEQFIKDSPFAPYLRNQLGRERFDELLQLFEVRPPVYKTYQNISSAFTDIFEPAYQKIDLTASYVSGKTRGITFDTEFDTQLFIDSIPDTIKPELFNTTRYHERFAQIAYIFNLNETELRDLVLKSLKKDERFDFDAFIKKCQNHYQNQPIHRLVPKHSPYDLQYLKTVHPKNLVEDLTGMHIPSSDLKIVEKLITKSDMPLEVLNVLIAYVLKELNHQFPVFAYFEKVIAQWKRADIHTAEDAINYMKSQINQKSSRTTSKRGKYQKSQGPDVEIDWLDEYIRRFKEES